MNSHPRPHLEASQYISNFLDRLGKIKTGFVARHFFNSSKLSWQSWVHLKSLPFSSSGVIGLAILEKSWMNHGEIMDESWRKLRISEMSVGRLQFNTSFTLPESTETPPAEMT
jgi:hypothetical protein